MTVCNCDWILVPCNLIQPSHVPRPRLRRVICSSHHHATLLNQLNIHAAKWRDISTNLGFQQGELDIIEHTPLLLLGAPYSFLRTMLTKWLEWAPNDQRGSGQYATLEALKDAVSKAGLGRTAESLTISDTSTAAPWNLKLLKYMYHGTVNTECVLFSEVVWYLSFCH